MDRRLSTGCAALDKLLGGGFRFGEISLVYGEASTGKTTIVLSSSALHLASGEGGKVFFVDSDGKLSTNRIVQVAGGDEGILGRLLVWRPSSFNEQTELIEGISSLLKEPTPVVVDSITGLYRLWAAESNAIFRTSKELNHQLGFLSEAAKTREAAVLLTGQVHGIPGSDTPQAEMVADRLLRYWSDVVLRLDSTHIAGVKQATIEKPKKMVTICQFGIGDRGPKEAEHRW